MELGEAAEEFLKGLTGKHPRNCGFHARHILRMKEHYSSDDIHRALEHALRYQAFEGGAIERILRAKAVPRTLESVRNERGRQELQQALPTITQRSLEEYSELLRQEKEDEERGDPDKDQGPSEDLYHYRIRIFTKIELRKGGTIYEEKRFRKRDDGSGYFVRDGDSGFDWFFRLL